MAQAQPVFEVLESLARQRSSDGRRELLHRLTDLFLDNMENNSPAHEEAFGEIICRVLRDVVEEAQREYAIRVASQQFFPRQVVVALGLSEAPVAVPILETALALEDDDLVKIATAMQASEPHLLAVSRRCELREAVTDILLELGGEAVTQSVAANPGAQFSEQGSGILIARSKDDEILQRLLVDRPDIGAEFAARLKPHLSAALKRRLARTISEDGAELGGLVAKAASLVENEIDLKRKDLAALAKLVDSIEDGSQDLGECLAELAEADKSRMACAVIAGVAKLPDPLITSSFFKVDGTPFAIICKALRVAEAPFAKLTHWRCRILKLPPAMGGWLAGRYLGLSERDSDRTLKLLRTQYPEPAIQTPPAKEPKVKSPKVLPARSTQRARAKPRARPAPRRAPVNTSS